MVVCRGGREKAGEQFWWLPLLGHLQMIMKPQPQFICIRVWICEIQSFTIIKYLPLFSAMVHYHPKPVVIVQW